MGGEEEALKRLQRFALEVPSQAASKSKATNSGDSLYGANFSCKISPWLAMGCLSPRRMFEDLKKNGSRYSTFLHFLLLSHPILLWSVCFYVAVGWHSFTHSDFFSHVAGLLGFRSF